MKRAAHHGLPAVWYAQCPTRSISLGQVGRTEAGSTRSRAATVEEVAEAIFWLSSSEASYVVGADLVLSGGWGG